MNNTSTQQQPVHPGAAVIGTTTYPTTMTAESVAAAQQQQQQQMSFLMNSGILSNPLFQQLNGSFMLQQQQQQQQQVQHAQAQQQQQQQQQNHNMNQQQQQQQQQQIPAANNNIGYDMTQQMMNFNVAVAAAANAGANTAAVVAQPMHTPSSSAAFGTMTGGTIGVGTSMAVPTKANSGKQQQQRSSDENTAAITHNHTKVSKSDRAKLNRDRNREHARSTRERKKAYVQKLRELVEKLHAERSEETRKRRVAVQHLAEIHRVRCDVISTFLQYHTHCELDERKWSTILEENDFYFRQPVTPYRSFHRSEIEKECRVSRGVQGMISDAASISVMLETIGQYTNRWIQIKRQQFITHYSESVLSSLSSTSSSSNQQHVQEQQNSMKQHHHHPSVIRCFAHQESRSSSSQHQQQRVLSSNLSSSSGDLSSETNAPLDTDNSNSSPSTLPAVVVQEGTMMGPKTKTGSSNHEHHHHRQDRNAEMQHDASKDFHDYNAMPLPDPKMREDDRNEKSSNNSDSSSFGEESENNDNKPSKRHKSNISEHHHQQQNDHQVQQHRPIAILPPNVAKKGGISHNILPKIDNINNINVNMSESALSSNYIMQDISVQQQQQQLPVSSDGIVKLPPNIAKKGGISHNIRPIGELGNGEARLECAPAIVLPPFRGLGSKSSVGTSASVMPVQVSGGAGSGNDTNKNFGVRNLSLGVSSVAPLSVTSSDVDSTRSRSTSDRNNNKTPSLATTTDADESSSTSEDDGRGSTKNCTIRGTYHINQDSQVLMGDVLMCPFIFRSHGAVSCGALSECIMPGMLRAEFSSRNKLKNLEFTYDAMGFMQQLARACGNDSNAQIVPSSVEMALTPCASEARVITIATPPYRIMNVNDQWTRLTGYTQLDAEGKEYMSLIEGEYTLQSAKHRIGKSRHIFDEVVKGRPACSTNIHYGKDGTEFIEFVSSFPLTNDSDEVTHILHIHKELPSIIRENDY